MKARSESQPAKIEWEGCFERDSRKTDRRDLELAKTRLKGIRQRLLDTK
jgi:hypothetical protein